MRLVWDIEATTLLDHTSIDYNASPYKLLPTFKIHCIVAKDIDTKEVYRYIQGKVPEFKELLKKATALVIQNGIAYDMLALKLYGLGIDYEITDDYKQCRLFIDGEEYVKEVVDTMVLSKTLNPDRYGGHSVDAWGQRLGLEKIDWRSKAEELGLIEKGAPRGAEFAVYHPEMLVYCERDVDVTEKIYWALMAEWGTWDWAGPFSLEQQVRDIVTRQEHRGFWFNKELAEESVRDLDQKMEEIKAVVEPVLPPKPLGVTKLKQFLPPKIQFKKNGEPSAVMLKWVERHGGTAYEAAAGWKAVNVCGNDYAMPMDPEKAVMTTEPATVKDTTHIKGFLVELGWRPTQYKERDLTCDSKKNKLTPEKFKAAVERYVEQTLESPFCNDRCRELDVSPKFLLNRLLKHDLKRPLKVYTNPTITVGMEKEIDPALLELADKFPHAKLVSEYLTYSHRRNSILGGGQSVFDDEGDDDEENEYAGKGFLAAERIGLDGRIPTPADTCGAGTSRFKHRLVANIPRVTSLYGARMRGMFGVNKLENMIQLGYDFDSLEAKIEAHYVFKYDGGPEYGVSLTADKPHDCHSVLALEITEILGRVFPRSTAKNVKYGCSYNAQVARIAKTVGCSLEDAQIIFDTFWRRAAPLKELKENMQRYWETTGQKKFLLGIDGRKLPIRSKGNVINTAFQSAGVICAKRAMVLHEKYLKEAGLYVDFFVDDWRAKSYCQQLIAYHDEAQLEVKRDQVKWKIVKITGAWTQKNAKGEDEDSDEVKAAKKELKAFREAEAEAGRVWSDVMHTDKMYYVGYCRAGELATIAVREAGKFYRLNVELSAGYMLGTDWASCH